MSKDEGGRRKERTTKLDGYSGRRAVQKEKGQGKYGERWRGEMDKRQTAWKHKKEERGKKRERKEKGKTREIDRVI